MSTLGLPQYLLESSFCLLVFYAFYYWVLRKETFFQINRLYLIVTPFLAILIPLFNIDLVAPATEATSGGAMEEFIIPVISNAEYFNAELAAQIEQTSPIFSLTFGEALMLVYFLGIILMSGNLLLGLLRLFKMIRESKQSQEENYTLVDLEGKLPAASFFSYVFWSGDKKDEKQRWILEHELVHLRQWHSLDVLTMELMVIIKWFNPLIYFFRESLKATHEYIADSYVVAHIGSAPSYAKVLVHQSNLRNSNQLVNTFSALIKKRLIMLGKDQSHALHKLKYFLSLPLLGILMMLFSFNLVEQLPNEIKEPLTNVGTYLEDLGDQDFIVVNMPQEQQRNWIDWGGEEIQLTKAKTGENSSLVFMSMRRSVFDSIQHQNFDLNLAKASKNLSNIEFRIMPKDGSSVLNVTCDSEDLEGLHQVLSGVKTDFNLFIKANIESGDSLYGTIIVSEEGLLNINTPEEAFNFPIQEAISSPEQEVVNTEELARNTANFYFIWGNIQIPMLAQKSKFALAKSKAKLLSSNVGRTVVDIASLRAALAHSCKIRNEEGVVITMDSLSFQLKKKNDTENFTANYINGIWNSTTEADALFEGLELGDELHIRQASPANNLIFDAIIEIGELSSSRDSMIYNGMDEKADYLSLKANSIELQTDYVQWGDLELSAHLVNAVDGAAKFVVQAVQLDAFEKAKAKALSVYHNGIKHPIEKVYISVLNESETPLFCDGGTSCFEELLPKIKSESSIQLLIRTESQKVFYSVFSISTRNSSFYRHDARVSDFINQGIKALSYRVISSIDPAKATFIQEPHVLEWGLIRLPFNLTKQSTYQGEIVVDYDDLIKSISKDIRLWINDTLISNGHLAIIRFPAMEDFPVSERRSLDVVDVNLRHQEESREEKINLLMDRIKRGDYLYFNADIDGLKFKLRMQVFNPNAPWRPNLNRQALLLERSIFRFQFIHKDGYRTRIKMDTTDAKYRWMYEQYKDGKQLDIIHIPNFKTVKRVINETDEVVPSIDLDQIIHLDESFKDKEIELYPEYYDFKNKEIYLNWRGLTGSLDNTRSSLEEFQASRQSDLELLVGDKKLEIVHFNITVVPVEGSKTKIITNTIKHETIDAMIAKLEPKTSIYIDKILVKQADDQLVHFPIALVYNLE